MNTRDEFRNVSVTETYRWRAGPEGPAHRGWLGVVDTRSQPVTSRRLNAGWLACCYSRRATRQTGPGAKPLVIIIIIVIIITVISRPILDGLVLRNMISFFHRRSNPVSSPLGLASCIHVRLLKHYCPPVITTQKTLTLMHFYAYLQMFNFWPKWIT